MLLFPALTLKAQNARVIGEKIAYTSDALDKVFYNYQVYQFDSPEAMRTIIKGQPGDVKKLHLQLGSEFDWSMVLEDSRLFAQQFTFRVLTEAGPVVTPFNTDIAFEGALDISDQSEARMTITDKWITGYVRVGTDKFYIEPLRNLSVNAPPGSHIVYSARDVIPFTIDMCDMDGEFARPVMDQERRNMVARVDGCVESEIALAGAFDMVGKYGSTGEVANHITGIMNNTQPWYVEHKIKYVIVDMVVPGSAAADPWSTATCMDDLLPSFMAWAPGGFNTHDVGQLWVNRDVARQVDGGGACTNTGLIGRAGGIGVICTAERYNCCEDIGGAAARAILSAHELGHDWGGTHGDAVDNDDIMFPSLNSNDLPTGWSAANTANIAAHLASRDCLDDSGCPCDPDDGDPLAWCQDVTVQLNGSGSASITASDLDAGSNDDCGPVTLGASRTSFNCSHVPEHVVTLTVTDGSGNQSSCNATVTVEDNIDPTAVCQDITVELDVNGQASISASDVDGGSFDNCDFTLSLIADAIFYNCDDVGTDEVTLTATDDSGNTDNCSATVTIEDNIPPVALCQDIVRFLTLDCDLTVDPLEIDAGSNDACGIASYELDVTDFGTGNVGANPVVLTVTDNNGNTASCGATVTILRRPTTLTNQGVFEGQYSDYPLIQAQLIDELTGTPIEGKDIDFVLGEGATGTSTPGGAIPDANPGNPYCDVISVADAGGSVGNVTVQVNLTHTWVGDLSLTLTSPDGTPITLLNRPGNPATFFGCSADNIHNLTFDDGSSNSAAALEAWCNFDGFIATTPWNAGLATGQPVTALGTLAGESANGDWTLCVSDAAGGDIGTLDNWSITVEWTNGLRVGQTTFGKDLAAERRIPVDYAAYESIDEAHKREMSAQAPPPAAPTTIVLTATTDASGIASIQPRLGYPQPPTILGFEYIITSTFADDDACWSGSSDSDPFTVLQEDARVTYTGKNFASTIAANSGDAVVLLAATICDISSTPDAAGDVWPGDISNATVTFVDRDNGNAPISPPLQVVPLPGDTTKGTVSFIWMTNIGLNSCVTYNIGIVVGNYYLRDDAADDQEIEICKPDGQFVTGGGYIILQDSWGSLPGDAGTQCNLGFNANFLGRNQQVSGQLNVIYRRMEFDGLHNYQIKSIKIAAVGVDADNNFAEFCGSGKITDVTTGVVVYPAGAFIVKVTDNGNPGAGNDLVGLAFYAPDGELVFSTNWTGTYTAQQVLNGGNIHIQDPGKPLNRVAGVDPAMADQKLTGMAGIAAEVYPNPFRDNVDISFTLENADRTVIEIISLAGDVLVSTDLGVLEGAVRHTWNYKAGDVLNSGTYLYRITSGDHAITGKIQLMK